MNQKPDEKECLMGEKDQQGNSNLCCCFAMDAQGDYENPCYIPVDACCLLPRHESREQ